MNILWAILIINGSSMLWMPNEQGSTTDIYRTGDLEECMRRIDWVNGRYVKSSPNLHFECVPLDSVDPKFEKFDAK